MREIIDLVIRTKDKKGHVRFWHKTDIDLESLVFLEDKKNQEIEELDYDPDEE